MALNLDFERDRDESIEIDGPFMGWEYKFEGGQTRTTVIPRP